MVSTIFNMFEEHSFLGLETPAINDIGENSSLLENTNMTLHITLVFVIYV